MAQAPRPLRVSSLGSVKQAGIQYEYYKRACMVLRWQVQLGMCQALAPIPAEPHITTHREREHHVDILQECLVVLQARTGPGVAVPNL